ncbi:MAG TPA: hypothetical protein PL070_08455, partial [Flavobacteriales bacterium]|nr:hypothetical protein [Flavobacteriales bacterium]
LAFSVFSHSSAKNGLQMYGKPLSNQPLLTEKSLRYTPLACLAAGSRIGPIAAKAHRIKGFGTSTYRARTAPGSG